MTAVQDVLQRQILIVEDDSDTAEVVAALLETAGYTTVSVESGSNALEEIQNSTPDLVLLDLHLPDIDGFDVLRQVREHSFLPLQPGAR